MVKSLQCRNCNAALDVARREDGAIHCDYCGTDNVLEAGEIPIQAEYSRQFTSKLFRIIDEHFTEEETIDLVAELDSTLQDPYRIQYDDLGGSNQRSKARELVLWCERRRLLQELVDVVLALRPSIRF